MAQRRARKSSGSSRISFVPSFQGFLNEYDILPSGLCAKRSWHSGGRAIVPAIGVFVALQRFFLKGLIEGAVKG
jgi:hypothetical protein